MGIKKNIGERNVARKYVVQMRLTIEERDAFVLAADIADGETLSGWCRTVLRREARKLISRDEKKTGA